ncbi:hypothetical protein [Catellatospora chokoriensis]|uniref:DUF2637 domain-containing protein n=1 Tax=Catellatospora chokoriensis TaxID=310353 RepID=A0A8J3K6E1_9ACTN|nr:hypothetical protein [Catellatospora chokoriensis]GIF94904.1 hypothetical protein Cch02nite_83480 [Catellatospora chokoriensis]
MATNTKRDRGGKFETFVLVLILLAVGGAAGAASFTHVHDWTMHNSPTGTGDWFGWANAVISELIPIAAMLVMRRRHTAGQSIGYPIFLLVAALGFSVAAQLAVAKPGATGYLVSVFPALAFAALAKLILGKGAAAEVVEDPAPTAVRDVRPRPVAVPDVRPRPQDVPVTSPTPLNVPAVPATPAALVPVVEDRPEPAPATPAAVVRAVAPVITNVPSLGQVSDWPAPPLPADLLDRARAAATEHEQTNGRPITRDELRAVLRVSNDTTGQIMRTLGLTAPRTPVAAVNGTPAPGLL